MTEIEELVLDLHRKFEREQETQRLTRGLDVITDMVIGMSYLLLGLSIPMVSSTMNQALAELSFTTLPSCFFSVFLVWLGVRLMKAALGAKTYFLDHPEELPSFLTVFQRSEAFGPELRSWLIRPDIVGTPFAKDLKRVGQAFQVGIASAVLIGATMLLLYFGAIFVLLSTTLGALGSSLILAALVLGYGGALGLIVKMAMKKPGHLPEVKSLLTVMHDPGVAVVGHSPQEGRR